MNTIYAKCTIKERKKLWDALIKLANHSLPWRVGGDFNTIVDASEKEGGAQPNRRSMNDFGTCILDCGLVHIGF